MNATDFIDFQKELFHLFGKGNYDEVHSLVLRAQNDFPERKEKIYFWKACAYSMQGKDDEAITALEEGLQMGAWWNPTTLTRDPDLMNLQSLPKFISVVKQCENILVNHQLVSTPKLFTYGNHQSDIGLLSLHWRGSNVEDFAPYWLDRNQTSDFHIGFLQSSQVHGYNGYCWDDEELADKEIKTAFDEFKATHHASKHILTGASQGGKYAIEGCLKGKLDDLKGFIAVIPAIQNVEAIESLLKENKNTNLRGCIITGDQDSFYEQTVALKPIFEKYNFPCKLIVVEGLGHFFPNNFPELLTEAVNYLLE